MINKTSTGINRKWKKIKRELQWRKEGTRYKAYYLHRSDTISKEKIPARTTSTEQQTSSYILNLIDLGLWRKIMQKKNWQLWNWMQILVRKIMIVAMFIHGLLGYMGPWRVNHIWVVECAYVPLAQTHPSGKLRVAYLDFSYLICRLFMLIVDIHLWTFLNFKGYIKPKIWWIYSNVDIQYTLCNI